jgi:alpha,alpha-trehalose phosphorylase
MYLGASGDTSILDAGGAEMLAETARIWLQIGFHDPSRGGAFVINRVTGPDEYSAIVDNNLYTNMMAAEHLRFAAEFGRVDPVEAESMRRAADAMFLPFDSDRGVYAQDEAFFGRQPWPFEETRADHYPLLLHYHPLTIYRHRVAKQADAVLAVALMPDAFEPEVRRRMLDTYEAVTVHDSTLSASAFATAAARSGDAQRASSYWRAAALTDLADLFDNSGHGLHLAALAGSWTAIAFGFAGLRAETDCAAFDPIRVPALGSYGFSLMFRQSQIKVTIREDKAHYERLAGPALQVRHSGELFTLTDVPVVRPVIS